MENLLALPKVRNEVASKIRAIRLEMGLTQEEFAHQLGFTMSSVVRWENNHGKPSKVARMLIKKAIEGYRERIAEHSKKYAKDDFEL